MEYHKSHTMLTVSERASPNADLDELADIGAGHGHIISSNLRKVTYHS
jgi:hypothetical protein